MSEYMGLIVAGYKVPHDILMQVYISFQQTKPYNKYFVITDFHSETSDTFYGKIIGRTGKELEKRDTIELPNDFQGFPIHFPEEPEIHYTFQDLFVRWIPDQITPYYSRWKTSRLITNNP